MVLERKNRCIRSIALGLALIVGFAVSGAAQALNLTQTQQLNVVNSIDHQWSTSFNGFNVSGATLTAVTLDWGLTLDLRLFAEGCLDVGDCEPSIMDWNLGGGGGAFANNIFDQTSHDYGFTNNTNDPQEATFQLSLNGSNSFANFTDFLGAGTIGIVENFWASQALDPDGIPQAMNYEIINNQILMGGISLIYTYRISDPAVPAPAPPTLAMLGLGLAGIGFQRLRKTIKL